MPNVTYVKPGHVDELLSALDEAAGKAAIIAGGTNLIPLMRDEALAPQLIVDISQMQELAFIKEAGGQILIGAATTMAQIQSSELLKAKAPLLVQAAAQVGNPMTRNRATIGGNIVNASPAADTAPPLLALDAALHLADASGTAQMPLSEFFLDYRKINLEPRQMVSHFSFAIPDENTKGCFEKLGLRNAASISVISLACLLEMDGDTCTAARLALGSVAPIPLLAKATGELLRGRKLDEAAMDEAVSALREEISPIDDVRASAEYRRQVAGVMFKRALKAALAQGEA